MRIQPIGIEVGVTPKRRSSCPDLTFSTLLNDADDRAGTVVDVSLGVDKHFAHI